MRCLDLGSLQLYKNGWYGKSRSTIGDDEFIFPHKKGGKFDPTICYKCNIWVESWGLQEDALFSSAEHYCSKKCPLPISSLVWPPPLHRPHLHAPPNPKLYQSQCSTNS